VADLIAQGPLPYQHWRRAIPPDQWIVLGRGAGTWAVPWDEHISRRHARLHWRDGQLEVERLATARNAIFLRGQEAVHFELRPGERFVIGETTFSLADDPADVAVEAPQPAEELAYSTKDLEALRFRNADQRLEVLSRLPDVISGSANDEELFVRLVNLVLAGISRAETVALLELKAGPIATAEVRILHWDRRIAHSGPFHPSARLIREALRRRQSVLHVWRPGTTPEDSTYTVSAGTDWAFCTPVRSDDPEPWALYVAGRFLPGGSGASTPTDPKDLRDDLKFTELAAAILGALRQVRRLQRSQAVLGQFFSPVVMSALAAADPDEVMAPRQTEVSILFCDLRGFSRESEMQASDLMGLLERVSRALRVMTQSILDHGGVIGDFQGDAAMGFWGWPLPQTDATARACLAALAIRAGFAAKAQRPDHPLVNFRVGIGLATGQAVAGKIGTLDQAKVSVFGPVVNLASRLEGMTKILHAPILLDEPTAQAARRLLPPTKARFRRVARVKPYGLDTPVTVTELVPPVADDPTLTDEHLATYESAFDAFQAGRWAEAYALLSRIPPDDQVKDFLTVFIAQHNRVPPSDWDGVIPLTSKS
jgi:adenylate cyclase